MSELWDEANGNEPVVGTVSYEGWHLGMIGHGAQREGGDRDIAVLWEAVDPETEEPLNEWWTNEEFYELPSYLAATDLETLESYEAELDERDGLVDGMWFGKTLEELRAPLTRPGTPAFAEFTGDATIEVIRNEELGRDSMTDVFWVEMKMPDYAGHAWNMQGPEEADVLRETDRQMRRMKETLDRQVGEDNYVFVVSADHGQQPLADFTGGWRINNEELERDITTEFGEGVVEKATPVDVYLDHRCPRIRGHRGGRRCRVARQLHDRRQHPRGCAWQRPRCRGPSRGAQCLPERLASTSCRTCRPRTSSPLAKGSTRRALSTTHQVNETGDRGS